MVFSQTIQRKPQRKTNMQNTDAEIPGNNPPPKRGPNLISRDKNKFTKHILTWKNACQLAPLDMSGSENGIPARQGRVPR